MWWCGNNVPNGTKATASKLANGYGLFDIHGNVYEWVWDWYGLYEDGPETDPVGPDVGAVRVIRGGSWIYPAGDCRSAHRNYGWPNSKSASIGFRLARTAELIFADDFELGDTQAWSDTEP
jgi:formylglycine-generating enzyme required for sulfatase activity